MTPGHGRYVPWQALELGHWNKKEIDLKYEKVTNAEHMRHGQPIRSFKKINGHWFQSISAAEGLDENH